jgi:hypothetical protein
MRMQVSLDSFLHQGRLVPYGAEMYLEFKVQSDPDNLCSLDTWKLMKTCLRLGPCVQTFSGNFPVQSSPSNK